MRCSWQGDTCTVRQFEIAKVVKLTKHFLLPCHDIADCQSVMTVSSDVLSLSIVWHPEIEWASCNLGSSVILRISGCEMGWTVEVVEARVSETVCGREVEEGWRELLNVNYYLTGTLTLKLKNVFLYFFPCYKYACRTLSLVWKRRMQPKHTCGSHDYKISRMNHIQYYVIHSVLCLRRYSSVRSVMLFCLKTVQCCPWHVLYKSNCSLLTGSNLDISVATHSRFGCGPL